MGSINLDPFFRRHKWILPTLWVMVSLWIVYWVSYPVFYMTRVTWGWLFVLLKWWWAVGKTLYVLAGQLLIAVPATALACFIAYYAIDFTLSIVGYMLNSLEKRLKEAESKSSNTYSHTHSNGRTYTHTHGPEEDAEEDVEEDMGYEFRPEHESMIRAILEMKLRQKREEEDRERRRSNNATGSVNSKSKRKGKKRKS